MMISLGVLTYTLDANIAEMTQKAIDSYRPFVDELIVVENGGERDWQADTFIKFKQNKGYTQGVNAILQAARGDYIMVANNDTYLLEGDLKELCIPWTVTSPTDMSKPHHDGFSGSFFVVPKTILKYTGLLDEGMRLRYSDTQYAQRLVRGEVPIQRVDRVKIFHHVDQTIHKTLEMASNDELYYQEHQH